MEISSSPQPSALTANSAPNTANSVLTSDFEVFLKMLTTQAEYQDPLEPLDSSEYAAQLAQFSMVEQQVSTNSLLEQLISSMDSSSVRGAANWIGLEALTSGPTSFDGSSITVVPAIADTADEVDLVAYSSAGTEVRRIALPLNTSSYSWDGTDGAGNTLPYGEYTLRIESRANGETLNNELARTYSRITEIRQEDGRAAFVLQNGKVVSETDVVGLREPEAA